MIACIPEESAELTNTANLMNPKSARAKARDGTIQCRIKMRQTCADGKCKIWSLDGKCIEIFTLLHKGGRSEAMPTQIRHVRTTCICTHTKMNTDVRTNGCMITDSESICILDMILLNGLMLKCCFGFLKDMGSMKTNGWKPNKWW